MNKLFKSSMFGYKKNDVIEYIENLSSKTEYALGEAEDKIEELEKENEKLKENIEKYKNDAASVSSAIITAEKKAEEIISNAQEKAEKILKNAEEESQTKKAELENQLEESKLKLRKLNEEIRQLKTNIVISANKYTKELDSLMED